MGGQQKNFISDIVFFQHQDGMRKKVRRHFLQCILFSTLYNNVNVCTSNVQALFYVEKMVANVPKVGTHCIAM